MKKLSLSLAMLLSACSSPDAHIVAPRVEAGADTQTPVDAAPDATPTYEDAVLSATWKVLPNAPKVAQGKQDDIWFTSALRGFAVSGPASTVYRTEDGGDSWKAVYVKKGTYFRSVLFADDMHGFVSNLGPIPNSGITDTNVMYETVNGGDAWTPVTNITGPMPTGICNQSKIDATHLIAVGRANGPSHFMQSNDAGKSWLSTDLTAQMQMLIDARFTSPTEGIIVGGTVTNPMQCTILRTTDAGKTFNPVFTSKYNDTLCWKISFPSDLVGYVSIQDAGSTKSSFAKTIDGGKTWTEMPLAKTSHSSIGVGFITENIGWLASEDPTEPTYRSIDGGLTWTVDTVLKSPINRFRFVDKNTAYAIGGQVYKLSIAWK